MKFRLITLLAAVVAPVLVSLGGCSAVAYDDGYYHNHSYSYYYPDRYQRDYYSHRYYQRPVYVAPHGEAVIVRPDDHRQFVYERY